MACEEHPDDVYELMRELSPSEFLTIALEKLGEIKIETNEELVLLDKLYIRAANQSKDIKMKMLKPELRAKFNQVMDDMNLDRINFMSGLAPYIQRKGPYTKLKNKASIKPSQSLSNVAAQDTSKAPFITTKPVNIPSSGKSNRAYEIYRRSVKKAAFSEPTSSYRSSRTSDSSGSSDSEKDCYDLYCKGSRNKEACGISRVGHRVKPKSSSVVQSILKKSEAPCVVKGHLPEVVELESSENSNGQTQGEKYIYGHSPSYKLNSWSISLIVPCSLFLISDSLIVQERRKMSLKNNIIVLS